MATKRTEQLTPATMRGGRRRRIARDALLIVAIAVALLVLRAHAFDLATPPPLAPIADTVVTLPDGRPAALRTLMKPGVPTIVSLWASWCGPCHKEAPTVAQWQQRARRGKANVLYLNVRDPGMTRPMLNAVLARMNLAQDAYAVFPDAAIARVTGGPDVAIPRTLVYDADGRGVASITGYKPLALRRVAGAAGL